MNIKEVFGIILISPKSASPLFQEDNYLISKNDEKFLIINNIPRFVPLENYASSFGLQWNEFKKVQLDSFSHTTISRDRLNRIFGGSLEMLKNKTILEAGCGAGRFTEVLLQNHSKVFAFDISTAVEANYENCKSFQNYFVCQADILNLPVPPHQFDIVMCIGVIQHTPSPEKTIESLCSQVKPGGLLVIDHYTFGYPLTPSRRILRSLLIRLPPTFSLRFIKVLTTVFWPFHKGLNEWRENRILNKIRQGFLFLSPVVDYHDSYPQLNDNQLKIWAVLDTYDTLTDQYKHIRSGSDIRNQLLRWGMDNVQIAYAGNGIEARANKPIK